MPWIISSLLMFISSIAFYLCVKKLQVLGIDKRIISLGNFFFPAFIFFILILLFKQPLILALWILLAIFILRVFFNYLGTLAGFKAMNQAPNAGYSLVIQKSYAVYTIFASALLFGSELLVHKVIITFFILACGMVVAIEPGKKMTVNNYQWVIYSSVAFFCFGSISLSSKYFANLGVTAITQLFWTNLLTLCITGVDINRVKKGINFQVTREVFIYFILLGLSVTSFYYFKLIAEVAAPNLGYVGTINAASNAVYTIIVAIIFKDHLSWKKFLAVGGVTAGLVLLLFT